MNDQADRDGRGAAVNNDLSRSTKPLIPALTVKDKKNDGTAFFTPAAINKNTKKSLRRSSAGRGFAPWKRRARRIPDVHRVGGSIQ